MFEYILFDLDGTLTDPKVGITSCVQYALKSFGIEEADLDKLTPFIGPPLIDSYKEFYGLTDEQAQIGVEKYRERFSTTGWLENEIYPGMADMLKALCDKGVKLAVASSKPEVFVEKILDHFQIREYFTVAAGASLDASRNDKKAVMRYAFECLGILNRTESVWDNEERKCYVTEAEKVKLSECNCAMVGDRKFDVEGAKEFGVVSVAVTYGYAPDGELEECEPDYIVNTVEELQELLMKR